MLFYYYLCRVNFLIIKIMKKENFEGAPQNAAETVNAVSMAASVEHLNNVSNMKQEELMLEATAELQRDLQEEASKSERAKYEVKISLNGECRMAAFSRTLNRRVNTKVVSSLAARMKEKGYRKAEVIQVMKAEGALALDSTLELVDQYGEVIKPEDAGLYYLVIEGQHRTLAAQLLNDELSLDQQITVPAVEVELAEGETLGQYIYDINSTKEEWTTADYAQSAQQAQQNPLLERYAALMKSKSNPVGLSLTTLNRIYCGNPKAISGADFKAICEGRMVKGKKQHSVIPAYNLERGNNILSVFESAGIIFRDMNKKYIMDLFDELELKYDREVATDTFALMCKGDVEEMRNKRGVLDETRFTTYARELAEQVNGIDEKVA